MQFQSLLWLALAAIASANPTPSDADSGTSLTGAASCGAINGNCYQNDCNGNTSGLRCTTGPYQGCECGFGCGSSNGPCDSNGCNGVNRRCTGNYLGCSCD